LKLRSFTEAREFVHKLGLKNQNEWKEYAKSKDKPTDIPLLILVGNTKKNGKVLEIG
jgi:hypothetical protein